MSHRETLNKLCVVKKPKHEWPNGYTADVASCSSNFTTAILGNQSQLKICSNSQIKRESKVRFYLKFSNKLELKS